MSLQTQISALATRMGQEVKLKEVLTNKGAANGYCPLGADAKIPDVYLPSLAISEVFVVANQAAMIADLANTQAGDVYKLTAEQKVYMRLGTSNGDITDVTEIDSSFSNLLDIDGTLTANSDTLAASQKATKTYVDTLRTDMGDHLFNFIPTFEAALL